MSIYIYRGRSKTYEKPQKQKKIEFLFENMCFIIVSSYPLDGVKSKGSKVLQKHLDSEVIEYNLDLFGSICKNPEIIVISGISGKEIIKHSRRQEYIVVENSLFEFTNSAEDLRLGLLATRSPEVIFLDSSFIPVLDTLNLIKEDNNSKAFCKEEIDNKYDIGVLEGETGYISSYTFTSQDKLTGMYYLNSQDVSRLRKKTCGSSFNKNKYAFEMFDEIKMKKINDTTNSILVAR